MVFVDAPDVCELLHCVLIRHVAILSVSNVAFAHRVFQVHSLPMPCDDVEWGMLLLAGEQLPSNPKQRGLMSLDRPTYK